MKNNPEDLLKSPDTVNVWERYVVGIDDANSQNVQQRRLLLQHIALFKRFGFGKPFVGEARAIAKIVERDDPQITWPRFQAIISDLKGRKILQGETTLYITPKALHIKLWIDWWNTHGEGLSFVALLKDLSAQLLEWFFEMFKYASESEVSSRFVKELLGENGPFKDGTYFETDRGSKFFGALTEADPKSALECLKSTIGTWSKKKLLQFKLGRREIVWALEKIAIWRELFADAARLLLMLGEAENESYANNATGIFAKLFSPGFGRVAPTEASPEERFPVLKEALESPSREIRSIALRACDEALESRHFSRMGGAEHQGLRREPQLWTPKTSGEIYDAYRRVWQELTKGLEVLPEDEQKQAAGVLLRHAMGLVRIQNLSEMIIDTIEEMIKKSSMDKQEILAEIVRILHYEGRKLPAPTRQRLNKLKNFITGDGFAGLVRRFVGAHIWEDEYDEDDKRTDQVQSKIEELARQAVDAPAVLQPELTWLLTTEVKNGHRFGYALGKRDKDFSLLPSLLDAQRSADANVNAYLLGGYFRAIYEKDKKKWEEILDALALDKKLNTRVPELTFRSGMSDEAALRILSLARKGIITIVQFRMFGYGSVIRELSEDVFVKWVEFLLSSTDDRAVYIALDLCHFYYLEKDSKHVLPKGLTLKLLTHRLLFNKAKERIPDQMAEYSWSELGKSFLKLYPEESLIIANKMIEHFGEDGTIFGGSVSQVREVLDEIVRLYPRETWKIITKYLGPPFDSRAFHIKDWLRGGEIFRKTEGALVYIPLEDIWKWVDKNVEDRAWYLATFVPKLLSRTEGKICLAREVLVRYGGYEKVKRNLVANFSTEGWSGPASIYYQEKKRQLLDFKANEDNENVKKWIDEYVTLLDRDIESARIEEERDEF